MTAHPVVEGVDGAESALDERGQTWVIRVDVQDGLHEGGELLSVRVALLIAVLRGHEGRGVTGALHPCFRIHRTHRARVGSVCVRRR